MDALTESRPGAPQAMAPTMPPESPIAMPVQSLSRFDKAQRRRWTLATSGRTPWLSRLVVFGGGAFTCGLTAFALTEKILCL